MQSDPRFIPEQEVPYFASERGNNYANIPVAFPFAVTLPPAAKHLMPVHGIEFQSSEACPTNFIIFDRTDYRSQIMFHPTVAHKLGGPALNMHMSYFPDNFETKGFNNSATEIYSSAKEDSDDIDALLSLEEEEKDECNDEVASTARTYGCYGSSSSDSCSSNGYKPRKNGLSSAQKYSSSGDDSNSKRERRKMKKMVKALRKIIPGGDQMNTVNVLNEAVKYLKSLKVEVQKLDAGDFKN